MQTEKIASLSVLDKQLGKDPSRQKVILADSNTSELCLSHLISKVSALSNAQIIEVEAGEEAKTLETYASIIEALLEQGADRATQLVALGGGVVCDIAGFVGGTFKRGVDTFLVPTTTLAMVDAAIGGKCGLDIGSVKNQVGLFHRAALVCVDTAFLETLPERQLANGAVEMLKIALVADEEAADKMMNLSPVEIGRDKELIRRCIALKQAIVKQDRMDLAERRLLNFGHTLGHAIESMMLNKGEDILHGEAVANGIYHAASLSKNLSKKSAQRIRDYIARNYQILDLKDQLPLVFNYMNADKKNRGGNYRFVLLDSVGKGSFDNPISRKQIEALLS